MVRIRYKRHGTDPYLPDFYKGLIEFANYGPTYRRVQEYYLAASPGGGMEALVKIRGNDGDLPKYVRVYDAMTPAHQTPFQLL